MKQLKFTLLALLFLFSCTKVEFDEELPSIEVLDPVSMESNLKRLNIKINIDDWNSIYENFHSDIQAACSVDMFDKDGNFVFSDKKALLEIRGVGSAAFPMKPIGLLFEDELDNTSCQIINPRKVYAGHDLSSVQNLRLRNSGNDYGYTQIKDFVLTEFTIDFNLNVEVKYAEPVQVFVNGAYYGLLNLRNEADEIALALLYNCDVEEITYVKVDITDGNLKHKHGDEQLVSALKSAIKHYKTDDLMNLIDIGSFIDYILIEDYFGNDDWPHNNVAAYSINGSAFKFVLYDLDQALFRTKDPCLPELEYLSADIAKIYQALSENEAFNTQLKNRQAELYSQFSSSHFNSLLDKISNEIEDDIPYLISKWKIPKSRLQWKINLESLKRDFAQRDKRLRKFYKL